MSGGTPGGKIRILLVEDDRENCLVLEEALSKWGYETTTAFSGEEAIALAKGQAFDIVLTDIRLGQVDGLQVLRAFQQLQPGAQVITMTGFGSVDTAVEAIQAGAFDYISKPFKFDEIRLTLSRAVEQLEARKVATAASQPPERHVLIGHSRAMAEIYKTIAKVAAGSTNVLIQGESGTGKELVARAIHSHSARAAKPFVAVNCAALPETLLESELFGYARGAHSTASADKPGMFELASGGTLMLDEVGDMSPSLQAKLLRVLEDSQTRRLGDTRTIQTDVRIVAATNRDLDRLVREDRFRADLYYRIIVVTISLPPLRERKEDIPALVDYFIRLYGSAGRHNVSGIAPEALACLLRHDWPGNVRELENVIERAVILNAKRRIMVEDLPEALRADAPAGAEPSAEAPVTLQELERLHIQRILQQCGGNIKAAAGKLGIDRKTLYRRLAEYGFENLRDPEKPAGRP